MIVDYKEVAKIWETQKPIRSGKAIWSAIADAINKQIPCKPILETKDLMNKPIIHISYSCPRCKVSINDVLESPYSYCMKCGQAIDKGELNH